MLYRKSPISIYKISVSAKRKKPYFRPPFRRSGRSVARLSRLVWDQEVASSNLAAPTNMQSFHLWKLLSVQEEPANLFDRRRVN